MVTNGIYVSIAPSLILIERRRLVTAVIRDVSPGAGDMKAENDSARGASAAMVW
jgi:hypothetical protein